MIYGASKEKRKTQLCTIMKVQRTLHTHHVFVRRSLGKKRIVHYPTRRREIFRESNFTSPRATVLL